MALIDLDNVSKVYQMGKHQVHALRGVTFEVEREEYVAIMGPSGSGKSTVMNIMGCLDRPTSGVYRLEGRDVTKLTDLELARIRNQDIGFVFQTFNLLPRTTALENVELPLIYSRHPGNRRQRAFSALRKVGLGQRVHHRSSELSGGQQQMVAIARAVVNEPTIILADEPTGNLDSKSGIEIMKLFQKLHESGITLIVVTHEHHIAAHAKRIIRFHDGQIVEDALKPERTVYSAEELRAFDQEAVGSSSAA